MAALVQPLQSAHRASVHDLPAQATARQDHGHPLAFLTPDDWMVLKAKATTRTFADGEALLQQDVSAQGILILCKGRARVVRNVAGDEIQLAVLGPGEICGDMAFLENAACSANVIAEGAAEAYAISDSELQELFQCFPNLGMRFYRSVAMTLSRRLRRTSSQTGLEMARSLAKTFGDLLMGSRIGQG